MELKDYLRVLRRNWIVLLVCTLLGLGLSSTAALVVTPSYTAKTQLFVAIQSSGTVTELQQGNTFTQARILSYVETAATPVVLQPVIDALSLDISPEALSGKIKASADTNTVLITITASDDSPVQAAALAQAVAESLIKVVQQLESTDAGADSPVRLSVVTPASAPGSPSDPNVSLYIVFGTVLGLLAGLALALLRSSLDTKVRGEDDLRRYSEVPLLGGIAFDADATKKTLITQVASQSPRAEAFRQIRTNLQFAKVGQKSKSVLVTSSLPGEGKSTTASNLAIAMAHSGLSVALVDADLRRPMLANYLGLERNVGLTTALVGEVSVEDLMQPWGEGELHVLTSGQIPPNPSELLGSEAMSKLIGRLEDSYDAVVIDAPPLIPVTDAAVLAQKVGGVILVIGSGKIRKQDLAKSVSSLKLVGSELLGVVFNLLPAKGPDAYAYSYYSYESKPQVGTTIPARPSSTFNGSHVRGPRRSRMSEVEFEEIVGERR